jgi:hypothetical protein
MSVGRSYCRHIRIGRKQPMRQIFCLALVHASCGHKSLRATLDKRELPDQLPLQFDRQSVEIAKGAGGAGYYMLIPLWKSAPSWQLVCPETNHCDYNVVDWVWLTRDDSSLFVAITSLRRAALTPDWPVMTVRVNFTESRSAPFLIKRDRCIRGGCPDCGSLSWHRR